MKYKLWLLVLLLNPHENASAQILPKDNSILNYRIINFSLPQKNGKQKYRLEIAAGYYKNADSFSKAIIYATDVSKWNNIAEVPEFGSDYTWRMTPAAENIQQGSTAALHHFSTGDIPNVDTSSFRLRIIQPAIKYKDAYIFVDATRTLYDMAGNPVWYLPLPAEGNSENIVVRDLKMSPQKTITYLSDKRGIFEINYNGDTLWRGPGKKGPKDYYHHEFTRLLNGHYMALTHTPNLLRQPRSAADSLLVTATDKDKADSGYKRALISELVEYDSKGKVLWLWDAAAHYTGTALLYHTKDGNATQEDAHENSFFFDEHSKIIYLSCRDISRIIKIKYPEGNILAVYGGDNEKPGSIRMGSGSFCGQHSVGIAANGNLYLYNNNVCNSIAIPEITELQLPRAEHDSLKKMWSFSYGTHVDANREKEFSSGGNVSELPGKELFVSMAYPSGNIFIVNENKELLWNAIAEKKNEHTQQWEPMHLYRASVIASRKELEQLILKNTK